MVYVNEHIRLSWGGTTASGNEIWSTGIALGQYGAITNPLDWFDAASLNILEYGDAISVLVGSPGSRVPAGVTLNWCKMALIGLDGKYMTEAVEIPLTGGGNVNAAYSPQDAVKITYQSEVWKDPGKYNGFYLPTVGPVGTNEWKFSTQEQNALVAAAVLFADQVNEAGVPDVGQPGTQMVVVSNTREGSESVPIAVRVGAIVDTQRRRRNKLQENYVTSPLGPQ